MTTTLEHSMESTDRMLVALTPQDVPAQQAELRAWCERKIHNLEIERSDMIDNARIAADKGLKYTSFDAAAKRVEKRITYYRNILAAVEAGYLIVPNFEVEVIAVRVEHVKPHKSVKIARGTYNREPSVEDVTPQLLPAGKGRYVDTRVIGKAEHWTERNEKNELVHVNAFTPTEYDEPDFPVRAIKPIVLDATTRAMSLKIFDRIGVVTGRREDPLVIGQLIDPRLGMRWGRPKKVVSFFIAWWLDTRTL